MIVITTIKGNNSCGGNSENNNSGNDTKNNDNSIEITILILW